jgi:phenylacetic acid degradation protein
VPAYCFENLTPVVHPGAFVHPEAVLIGDVIVGDRCFVGPGAVLRGDLARITIGEGSNIQDGCIVHSFPGGDVVLENDTHIGHGAVLHGCRICRAAMVGIRAVVMDGAVVGEQAIVAAMSFVKTETHVPPRMLAMGIPARIARPLTPAEIEWRAEGTRHYQELTRRYRASLRPVQPMDAIEPGRPRLPSDGPTARPPQ